MSPRVTIGMPAFNRAHVLGETIGYVLAQTFSDFELIIFNDGSTDQTADVIRGLDDPRIQYIESEHLGPPHPLNQLYERARGEYFIILHDHDIFDPRLLELSVAALDANPRAGLVLQGAATVAEDGCSNLRPHLEDWPELNSGLERGANILLSNNNFASPFHACSMVRRSALNAVGPRYDPSYGIYSDGDLWFRLLLRFDFVYLREVLFHFRERERRGHFLIDREFEVLDIMRRIFLAHGVSYFADDALRMSSFLAQLSRVYCRVERRAALRALLKGTQNRSLGLTRVVLNRQQNLMVRTIAALARALKTAGPHRMPEKCKREHRLR